ncbi:hypothetical protein [Fulvimarina sp. MAC3]|uniref:hypothetical protein n=1 Tax=Fulvimarina sp. MAC3 TaxID=3148887 RepID=UPI0031FD580D
MQATASKERLLQLDVQELVARYPELITDGGGHLLLVRREQAISDGSHGVGRWSLDHLFVTRNAVPVLVELKRAVDTRLRREVVGQMLDYATNATAYWQAGKIAERFRQTSIDASINPEETLAEFIGDQDPDAFWEQVDSNFKAGRIKLVFVADEIPRELARIVEFLNEQMRADVRAVELRWFTSEDGHVSLSPRIIGETERAVASKSHSKSLSPITEDEWIEKNVAYLGDDAKRGAFAFMRCVHEAGGSTGVANDQGSIFAVAKDHAGRAFYPSHMKVGRSGVSFSLRWLADRPQFAAEDLRRALYDELVEIVGPLSTQNLRGFPSFQTALLADPSVALRFTTWLKRVIELSQVRP